MTRLTFPPARVAGFGPPRRRMRDSVWCTTKGQPKTLARTGLTKSILRAPNKSCSFEDAHCMKYQVASLFCEKLDMASDQIQTFGVGASASGLGAIGA